MSFKENHFNLKSSERFSIFFSSLRYNSTVTLIWTLCENFILTHCEDFEKSVIVNNKVKSHFELTMTSSFHSECDVFHIVIHCLLLHCFKMRSPIALRSRTECKFLVRNLKYERKIDKSSDLFVIYSSDKKSKNVNHEKRDTFWDAMESTRVPGTRSTY